MTDAFFEIVTAWEIASISLTLLISAYLIVDLVAAVLSRPLARSFPRDPRFPLVSVVIPAYNEPTDIVRATLASWKAVRYPSFELILADDSEVPIEVDDPSVRIFRRSNREGFKGGALREAFERLHPESEWMVVFDADFLVDPDILVRFSEHYRPGVGAIQGYQAMGRNDPPTYLTRYSESFHAVANTLLTGRYRLGGFVGVQGTVQAYRVEAIRALGGIAPYTTANEDLDTTFRLRKAGWKIVYDPALVGRGIAPERYRTLFTQVTRWTSTTVREYRRHYGSFVRSPEVPALEKFDALLFLLTWINSLVVTPTLVFLPWAISDLHLIPLWLSVLITALPIVLFTLPMLKGTPARLGMTGWLGYYVLLVPGYFVMFRASLLGFFTDPGFVRTPKTRRSPIDAGRAGAPTSRGLFPGVGARSARVGAVQVAACSSCGRRLTHRETLFYAVGALDVGTLTCRRCLRAAEWERFGRSQPAPVPAARTAAPSKQWGLRSRHTVVGSAGVRYRRHRGSP